MKKWQIEYKEVVHQGYIFEVEAETYAEALSVGRETLLEGLAMQPDYSEIESSWLEAEEIQ